MGKTIRRQTADKGPDSDYISVPNGGNGKNLHFPPFTFYGVPKERGVLKAVGYHQGKKVAEYTVKTPESRNVWILLILRVANRLQRMTC